MESPEGKTVGPKRPGRFRFVGAVEASAALACVGTLTAFLDLGWLPELTSHLRPQYAVLLVAAAVGFGVLKRPKRAVLFGCFALLNVLALAPWLFSRSATTSEGTAFRVLVLNVNTANTRHDAVRAEIRRLDPDVVLVMEVDNLWLEQLRELRTKWPHWVTAPRPDNFGIALFSKRELSDARAEEVGDAGVPTIIAEVDAHSQPVLLLGTLPLAPGRPENAKLRDEQLALLAARVNAANKPAILFGDLNVTPWSPRFRELERTAGLRDTMRGFGLQPTWPAPVAFAGIPLDHCLVTSHFTVKHRERTRHIGSDHLGVWVDLVIGPAPSVT
jgi:endonuclease/exonuclease/phosphatase (EEP) superfamily protein YafD